MNIPAFLLDLAIAESQPIPQTDAVKLAIAGSFVRQPFLGLVLVSVLARQEAQNSGSSSGSTLQVRQTGLLGRALASRSAAQQSTTASNLVALIAATGMPSFHGMDKTQAEKWAQVLNLKPEYQGVSTGKVEWQEPGVGEKPPNDNTIKLRFK